MTYIERIVELDGTVTEKPYSKEQIEAADKIRTEDELLDQAEATRATERVALLAKLGITQDEAALLLS